MDLHTSGDVKARAMKDGVAADRLAEFVRRFHMKSQYLGPEAAYNTCLADDKKHVFGGHPGQIPMRKVGNM